MKGAASTRSYAVPVTINAGSTWEYKTVTIPGDTAGTWATDNASGARICFTFAAGTGRTGTANVWSSADIYAHTGVSNFYATNNYVVYVTGVVVLPGVESPTAARSPLIMRPYDQELLTCRRYYVSYGGNGAYDFFGSGQCTSAAGAGILIPHSVPMRASPTLGPLVGLYGLWNSASSGVAVTAITISFPTPSVSLLNVNVASGLVAGNATMLYAADTNARIRFDARL